ncbi:MULTISPECIES: acyltransferase family protein [Robiginitalea]|uniref:Acyltransferase 3 domain-containing protein n=1 Tax=Robiginitalea biformata (strain ATCC BAA-864 / DSM 15991 / KCTC 12146 / HTCC2501) TaxID=313596 RepID=A4CKW1_ROBBH|nr:MULTISPECIES: acyltransferase family protein [Robiginitalea]EAR15510.1 hypothetical protein RB2501_14319 [Robiginitalea biformata HTCC2501]MDC6353940.1 heparan-alpha-glucosaminide N-acetyltransferase domain-containing protein [Robiginitalea sp. PM2]MDC6374207.1 heparan-alpha-glucosaminide N-acetyltransferase domain-containing protein [Robiginitalea sp. SP8]
MGKPSRLYFIDAMRAWAILMMLQGHFIDGLLDPLFRDPSNPAYATWLYFRGITAPVFFTVSGFIFTYLLLRTPRNQPDNPRIRKGIRRGLQLVAIGYLLRTNLFGLLQGQIYPSFYLVDVLHCIGVALLLIIGIYQLTRKFRPGAFPVLLLMVTVGLFLFEPVYKTWTYEGWPAAIANYLTKANGSVFTIVPWVGYTAFGAFLATAFRRYANTRHLYVKSILLSVLAGVALVGYSSAFFSWVARQTGWELPEMVVANNYLFIRLGDVLLVFAVFMLLRGLLKKEVFLRIGQNTLSIYVIHFIILYGSFTGLGLYRFLHHSLTPWEVIPGALAFMLVCTWAALTYDSHQERVRDLLKSTARITRQGLEKYAWILYRWARRGADKLMRLLGLAESRS